MYDFMKYMGNAVNSEQHNLMIYTEQMPEIRRMVRDLDDERGLITFGKRQPSDAALKRLGAEIDNLSVDDHKVSLIMADLETKSGIACRSSVPMCSQSTIKGIYIGALLDAYPGALEIHRQYMHDTIVLSDNRSYEILREIYGKTPLVQWCREADVDPSFAAANYPRNKTARDMFKMWTRLFCFLNGPAKDSELAEWFCHSIASATREVIGSRHPVHTKAGWENGLDESKDYDPDAVIPERFTDGDPLNDECAVNDSGIVYTETGPYIFVIYTDHPFGIFRNYMPENPLKDLVLALYEVHKSIAAG